MNDTLEGADAVRVLHVLGSLGRGGAETWLVQLLQHLDRDRVAVDVLTHKPNGAYEPLVESLGARVLCLERPTLMPSYASRLRRLLVEFGPYTAVHSHLQLFSGHIEIGCNLLVSELNGCDNGFGDEDHLITQMLPDGNSQVTHTQLT